MVQVVFLFSILSLFQQGASEGKVYYPEGYNPVPYYYYKSDLKKDFSAIGGVLYDKFFIFYYAIGSMESFYGKSNFWGASLKVWGGYVEGKGTVFSVPTECFYYTEINKNLSLKMGVALPITDFFVELILLSALSASDDETSSDYPFPVMVYQVYPFVSVMFKTPVGFSHTLFIAFSASYHLAAEGVVGFFPNGFLFSTEIGFFTF